jgi:hypothetical protein
MTSVTYRIALATAAELPDLDDDGRKTLAALQAAGHRAEPVVWNDESVEWEDFDAVLLVGAHDYSRHYDDFLSWMWKVADKTLVLNPEPLGRWYADKRYLRDYESERLPIVPTQFITVHDHTLEHDYLGVQHVVRASISGGLNEAVLFGPEDADASKAELVQIKAAGNTVMVSPTLPGATGVALVYLGGEFSHSFGYQLRIGGDAGAVHVPEVTSALVATEAEIAIGDASIKPIDPKNPPLYVRVDLVRSDGAEPLIIEVEVIDPELHFEHGDGAAERFAALVTDRIAAAGA